MNKEKWQTELKLLQLTEAQKSSMLQHVKSSKKEKVNWTYRLAVPTFAVLCILFLFLVMSSERPVPILNHGTEQAIEMDHHEYIMETLIYLAIAFSIYVINCILAVLIVKNTVRWQPKIMYFREKWGHYHWLFIGFMTTVTVGGASSLWFICSTQLGSKIIIFFLILIFLLLLQLYLARNVKRPLPCPVCHHTYSTREIRKIAFSFKVNLKCTTCEKPIFYTRASRNKFGLTSLFTGLPFFTAINIGLPFIVILCILVPYFLLVWRFILPYYIELEDEETPMW
ncbi:hypothetical protein [Solibacillus cecembensis]|uniref:hypothetical protein n=1 Tax=Solibacillus cecembensis TaxID=459347 RepID=UPI003CFFD898